MALLVHYVALMVKQPSLTSDQVVLRALRELCKGAGEHLPLRSPDPTLIDPEPTSLPSSVRPCRPEGEAF